MFAPTPAGVAAVVTVVNRANDASAATPSGNAVNDF